MAFSMTHDGFVTAGGKRIAYGSYNCASVTTGEVKTALSTVEAFILMPYGTSVATNQSTVDETFPLASGTVTIVTDSSQTGEWIAIGL